MASKKKKPRPCPIMAAWERDEMKKASKKEQPRPAPIWMVWEHEWENPRLRRYLFDTEAECEAFRLGVTEALKDDEWWAMFRSSDEAIAYLGDRKLG